MKKYNKTNGRKSIRLQGYDYSRAGLYFLTIVVQNRMHLFGYVQNGKMILNDAGRMVEKWYQEIENKYPDKCCHEMVIMPNHFHCIIEIMESDNHNLHSGDNGLGNSDARNSEQCDDHNSEQHLDAHVSGQCDDRNSEQQWDAHVSGHLDDHVSGHLDAHNSEQQWDAHVSGHLDAHVGASLRGRPNDKTTENDNRYGIHNKKYGASIYDVMDWFKTMTTNEYIRGVKNNDWKRFDKKLWQRRYYDHIIRNNVSHRRISNYIINNPAKWNDDQFHNKNK